MCIRDRAYWLGFSEVVTSLAWLDTWMERLAAVTADDVQHVAQRYFRRDGQTVGWYVPSADGGVDGNWSRDDQATGEEA